jgi:hypothetical protein
MRHRIASGLSLLSALLLAVTATAQSTPTAPQQAHPAGSAAPAANPAPAPTGARGAAAVAPVPLRRQYEIEIIVFRALKTLGSPEDWQAELHMAPHVSGAESPTGTGVGQLVQVLSPASYQLDAIWNALRTSADYAPVAHAAWIQTASDWGTHAGFNLSELGIQVPGLRGLVYFERGTYLHLGLTLDYTMQHPPAGLGAAPGTTFVMNETRRVRFYQRNYYDHPAFGVIALVLPVHSAQTSAP